MLTIVIPSYNHEKYIYECLSAASQVSISGLKILVIDDGSTDNTPAVIKKFINNNQNIKIELVEKKNSGLVSSLNLALELVGTKYIYICASDDVPIAKGIEECFFNIVNRKLNFVVGAAKGFYEGGEEFDVYGSTQDRFLKMSNETRNNDLFYNYPAPLLIQSTIFNVVSIKNIGGWDRDLKLDDYPFFIKMFTKYPLYAKDFVYLNDKYTVKYRQHNDNNYRNTFLLFSMVEEVVVKYSPADQRVSIIFHYAVLYCVSAIISGRFLDFIRIASKLSIREKVKLPFYIMCIFYKKIVG